MRALRAYRILRAAHANPHSIEWLVAREHVSASEAEIRTEIIRRTGEHTGWTLPLREAAVAYALHCHRHNGRAYRRVMRGMR